MPPRAQRPRARRGEGGRLREEILAAAEGLLLDTGDEAAVSIRAVADAVGVTPPALYLHFADKDELLFAVCERHFARLDEEVEAAVSGIADPLESLAERARAYVRFGLANPEPYRILFMSRGAQTEGLAERLRGVAAFGHLVEAVAACMDAGRLRRAEPHDVACGLWALVHGVTSLRISHPGFPWPPLQPWLDGLLATHAAGLAGDRPAGTG